MEALKPAMTLEEIRLKAVDIKRQTILLYKSGICKGPRRKRWEMAAQIVIKSWLILGPQLDYIPSGVIILP